MASAADGHLALLTDALQAWGTDRSYMNFLDRQASAESCFAPQTYWRLREVKTAYDPKDVFRTNHPIALID
ncbi:MAG: BBE domain-containing protein [Actinomycetota bacterium]|nr:BBE domain-containing protein [Actinomycetota bacterium]